MKIALGCDHGGYELKQFIMKTLEKLGYEYEDQQDGQENFSLPASPAIAAVSSGA